MNINSEEREYLIDLLATAHDEMLHELHHSDTATFDDLLKARIALNERLQERVRSNQSTAAA